MAENMMPWANKAINPGDLQMLEKEVTRRICVRCGLPAGAADAFVTLRESYGFPYHMVAHKFSATKLSDIDVDMRKRITLSAPVAALEAACEEITDEDSFNTAIVFNWPGRGGKMVFTHQSCWPSYHRGTCGQFWGCKDGFYFLETLESFIHAVGKAEDW